MASANDKQVAGTHYKDQGPRGWEEHWDRVVRLQLDYFQAQITKYTERARKKNGKQDIAKAHHFAEKYLEVYDILYPPKTTGAEPGPGYVNQDRGCKACSAVKCFCEKFAGTETNEYCGNCGHTRSEHSK